PRAAPAALGGGARDQLPVPFAKRQREAAEEHEALDADGEVQRRQRPAERRGAQRHRALRERLAAMKGGDQIAARQRGPLRRARRVPQGVGAASNSPPGPIGPAKATSTREARRPPSSSRASRAITAKSASRSSANVAAGRSRWLGVEAHTAAASAARSRSNS